MTEREITSWLEKGRDLLAESCGVQLGQVRVTVAYAITGEGIVWTLPPTPEGGRPAARFTTVVDMPPPLTPKDREVLGAVGEGCLVGKQIAGRLKSKQNSSFRGRLTKLRKLRVLGNDGRGYYLTALGRRALSEAKAPGGGIPVIRLPVGKPEPDPGNDP